MRYNAFKNSAKQRSAAMLPHNAVNADTPSLRSEEFDKAITVTMADNSTYIYNAQQPAQGVLAIH